MKKGRRAKKSSQLKGLVLGSLVLFFIIGIIGMTLIIYWITKLQIPDLSAFENRKIAQSTKIYDRTGNILLWDIHSDIKRTVVPFGRISRNIKNATVAIEDSEFYQHKGIDIPAIFRSIFNNIITGSKKQGGSTITQQLTRNTLLTKEKTFTRKIKEIVLALKIEKNLSKEKILELYLNEISYGGSNYGIEAASQSYFGKKSEDLTLTEASYLAALPQAPTYYSPFGNNKEKLEERKNLVLKRMRELNFITDEEKKQAENEKVVFLNKDDLSIKTPHFSIFIRSYLEEKYGKDLVEEGGLKVIATLDYELQKKAEEIVRKFAESNKKNFNASNAAMLALDPKTGQILVMVGSKDYFNKEIQGNYNVTLAKRQPGSSIKPFVYATAFKKGYTPDTILFDLPTEFNPSCNIDGTPKEGVKPEKCYHPLDYDKIFRGPITLRNALAQSVNIPSVKTLYLAGLKDSIKTMGDVGIKFSSDPMNFGLSLGLGAGEVTFIDLANAYAVFANNGIKNPYTGILKIEDSNGNTLEEYGPQSQQVLDKNITLLISDVLSDNNARTPAFGERSSLYFSDRQVAAKTGTTNDYHDAWTFGYTPSFVLGAWAGNNDNTPMEKKVAGFIVSPMWRAFFEEALAKLPKEEFEKPTPQYPDESIKPFLRGDWKGGETYKIDRASGKLATEFTPPELTEERILTQIHSILYWINKNNPNGPRPENPQDDPQFILWETPIQKWLESQNIKEETENDIPKETDDIHKPEYAPRIILNSPNGEILYNPNNAININFSHESKFGLSEADFFLDNVFLGSSLKEPFDFSFIPANSVEISDSEVPLELKIVVYDKIRNKNEFVLLIKFGFGI